MSPNPPTSSGIRTRSSRSNSTNTALTSSIPVKGLNMCQTRAASTRLPAKSRLPVAAKPPHVNNTENVGFTDLPSTNHSRRIVLEIVKPDSNNIQLTVDGRERKSSITQPKLIKKKRQSLTVQQSREDNDHDEVS